MSPQSAYNTIIFDFGGVLIDWNPKYLYRKLFNSEAEVERFLDTICTSEWNAEQDKGRDLNEATSLLLESFPKFEKEILAFYERWEEMLGGPIEGTVEILSKLNNGSYRLLGLTNWSQYTFPKAWNRYDFLKIFEGIVVSGVEKLIKPDPAIYQLLIDRYQVEPAEAIFIDDSSKNIEAAKAFGINGIQYTDPEKLRIELEEKLACSLT